MGKEQCPNKSRMAIFNGIAEQDPYIFKDSVLNNIIVYNDGDLSKSDLSQIKKNVLR